MAELLNGKNFMVMLLSELKQHATVHWFWEFNYLISFTFSQALDLDFRPQNLIPRNMEMVNVFFLWKWLIIFTLSLSPFLTKHEPCKLLYCVFLRNGWNDCLLKGDKIQLADATSTLHTVLQWNFQCIWNDLLSKECENTTNKKAFRVKRLVEKNNKNRLSTDQINLWIRAVCLCLKFKLLFNREGNTANNAIAMSLQWASTSIYSNISGYMDYKPRVATASDHVISCETHNVRGNKIFSKHHGIDTCIRDPNL